MKGTLWIFCNPALDKGVLNPAAAIECNARFALSLLGACYPMGSTHFRPLSKFIGGLRLPVPFLFYTTV